MPPKSAAASTRIYFVTGSDEAAVKETAAALAAKLAPPGDFGLELIDGWVETTDEAVRAVQRTLEALQTGGLFASDKLVWLKNASFLADSVAGRAAGTLEAVETLIREMERGLSDGTTLLISAPGADKRRTAYKGLTKLAKTEVRDAASTFGRGWEAAAANVVEEAFQQAGVRIKPALAERIVELCGADPRVLRNEASKVALYAGDEPVSAEHVETMVAPLREESLFAWADAMVEGPLERALTLLRQLEFQQEGPVGLLRVLTSHARLLVQCRILMDEGELTLSGRGSASLGPRAEVLLAGRDGKPPSAFRVTRVAQQARRHRIDRWLAFYDAVYETTLRFFDDDAEPFEHLERLAFQVQDNG